MDKGVLITWSLPNFVTVTLMAVAGFMVFAALTQFFKAGGVRGALSS